MPLQSGVEDIMTNRGFVLLMIMLLAGSGIVFAQSKSDAEQLYSAGVQAFNAQRNAEAIGCFNKIEGLGTQDPRAFYFRGLSHSRLGNAAAATADYETAARMELTVAGRSYSVPKALERIQGRERTAIELYRRAAKRAWETEQNVRKQDEFLSQKAEDMKFYQSMIDSGKSEPSSPDAIAGVSDLTLPFGAQPVIPFVANQQTFRTRTVPRVSQGGLSEENRFFDEVNRVTPVEQPEAPKPKVQPKPQDPGESGIFDFDNDEPGFDVSFPQPSVRSAPRSPFDGLGLTGLGGGNDDDFTDDFSLSSDAFDGEPNPVTIPGEGKMNPGLGNMTFGVASDATNIPPAKEGGRSFGKGFASLFKKSDSGGTSSGKPNTAPSNQKSTSGDIGGDDTANPFADPF